MGAGVLVPGGFVLTCAHVVAAALGQAPDGPPPRAPVTVDFSPSGAPEPRRARVVDDGWFPALDTSGDVAVLMLESGEPPPDAAPAPLDPGTRSDLRTVLAYGYPNPGLADGVWVTATVTGPGGADPRWRQLDGAGEGVAVQPGFSGAGVWDPSRERVLGLVVAAYAPDRARVSWMIPFTAVARDWPPLADALAEPGPREPYRDELTPRQCADLARLMTKVPGIETASGRAVLVSLLRPDIRVMIGEHPAPLAHLYEIVRVSCDYDGGLDELVWAITAVAGDARAVRNVIAAVRHFRDEAVS
ncbi:serine protease [Yinghuangia sp. ASG 101]|uniref:effector-associated domain 2-containing protein n=1 Tax=Yinghuangia sp. ASG 101 TaxID=2896848 RepID=UPI001E652CC0|nr:trypsin-like peptidase domain-containing protein [Yinghuangia sp. ASG 101]UGQ12638.1 serine protease [Yinghuangia sp. ASG 101]